MRLLIAFAIAAVVAASAGAASPTRLTHPEHIVVLVFENKDRTQVIGSHDAPTFTSMARRYANLTRYSGVTHPSLPNYLALVSGSTQGVRDTCTSCSFDATTLAATLQPRRTWRLYAEGIPRPGFSGAVFGRYAKKHVPFLYFHGVDTRNVVPFTRLRFDLARNRLPDFSMIVPDMCNSMHDCSVRVGDAWLRRVLPPLLNLPRSAVFVIFDEGSSEGPIPAFAAGTAVRPHTSYTRAVNHYGLLRTIEDAWDLRHLGESASATPITGIWK